MKSLIMYILFILLIAILLPTVIIQNYKVENINSLENERSVDDTIKSKYIKIYNIETKTVETIDFEDYIKGVLATEMSGNFHIEALKAQAVASRTYAFHRLEVYKDGHPQHPETALCTGIHCQAYSSIKKLEEIHGEHWMEQYWDKFIEAVDSTKGQIMVYNEKVIDAMFHSTSGGMTEDSEMVFASAKPYLRAVVSPYEKESPKFTGTMCISVNDFINTITNEYDGINLTKKNIASKIKIVERSKSNRVKTINIDGKAITGRELRILLGLNSTNFDFSIDGKSNTITFDTIGYGHGVGMSQWGANGMASKGYKYDEILKYFYTGVKINSMY
ncbi:MAG: stage II sporulation protein D [Firmicutes bacterium]|nr:stage II sporulation protein D [Bacillota bacterium]